MAKVIDAQKDVMVLLRQSLLGLAGLFTAQYAGDLSAESEKPRRLRGMVLVNSKGVPAMYAGCHSLAAKDEQKQIRSLDGIQAANPEQVKACVDALSDRMVAAIMSGACAKIANAVVAQAEPDWPGADAEAEE